MPPKFLMQISLFCNHYLLIKHFVFIDENDHCCNMLDTVSFSIDMKIDSSKLKTVWSLDWPTHTPLSNISYKFVEKSSKNTQIFIANELII